jgi:hypothetical protein
MFLYRFSKYDLEVPPSGVFQKDMVTCEMATVCLNTQHIVSFEARPLYVSDEREPSFYALKIEVITGSILTFTTDSTSYYDFAKKGIVQ